MQATAEDERNQKGQAWKAARNSSDSVAPFGSYTWLQGSVSILWLIFNAPLLIEDMH